MKKNFIINKEFKRIKNIYSRIEEKDIVKITEEFDILNKIDNLPFEASYFKTIFFELLNNIIAGKEEMEIETSIIKKFYDNVLLYINKNIDKLLSEQTLMKQEYYFRNNPEKKDDFFVNHVKEEIEYLKKSLDNSYKMEVKEIFSIIQIMYQLKEIKETNTLEYIHSFRTSPKNHPSEMFRPINNTNSTMFYGWLLENFNKIYIKEKKQLKEIKNMVFENHKEEARYNQFKYAMKVKTLKEKENKIFTLKTKNYNGEVIETDNIREYSKTDISEENLDFFNSLLTEENYQEWLSNNKTINVISFDLEGIDKYGNKIVIDVKNQSGISYENKQQGQSAGFTFKHSPLQWLKRLNNVDTYNLMVNQKSYYAFFQSVLETDEMTISMIPTVILKRFFKELVEKIKEEKNKMFNIPSKYTSTYQIKKEREYIENQNTLMSMVKEIKEIDEKFKNFLLESNIKEDLYEDILTDKISFSNTVKVALKEKNKALLNEFLKNEEVKNFLIELNDLFMKETENKEKIKENMEKIKELNGYLDNASEIKNEFEIKGMVYNKEKFDIFFVVDTKSNNRTNFLSNFDGIDKSNVLKMKITQYNNAGFLKSHGEHFILDTSIKDLKIIAEKEKEKVRKNREKKGLNL